MKKLMLLVVILIAQKISAQNLHQTLRGYIVDLDGQSTLVGATVSINQLGRMQHCISNAEGAFRFDKVPLGRVDILVSYIGYENKQIPNVELTSGKEVVLQIAMIEAVRGLDEVVVKAHKEKGTVENDMALVSARQVTVDETQRYAGSFNDPARMVSAFAGVQSNVEGDNDIVVRGNSPKYVQWRLEGVEMPNPNHFGDVGGTGGPISALNSNLLANSDFYTGAFAPEYGNVLSGVFDVKFRKGNDEKREYSLGIGALGVDASLEGPFKKGSGASYLFNYRYSSLALLNNLGLVNFGGVPKYQDAALKIVLPSEKYGSFTLFGMGGISAITQENADTIKNTLSNGSIHNYHQLSNFKLKNNLFIVGLNHLYSFSNNFYVQSGLSVAGSTIDHIEKTRQEGKLYTEQGNYLTDSLLAPYTNYLAKYINSYTTAQLKLNYKLSSKHKFEAGIKYTNTTNNYNNQNYRDKKLHTDLDFDKSLAMLRNYFSWKYRLSQDFTAVAGYQNVYVPFTNENSWEPRLSLRYQKPGKDAISIAYGKHSTMEQVSNYFVKIQQQDGSTTEPNKNLALLKAHHVVLGYEKRIGQNHLLKLETYYQHLYDLPVENKPNSYYATINEVSGFKNKALVNDGKGQNYGVELSVERFFSRNFYYLATASLYQSTYTAKDGKLRNTVYNNNYGLNFLVGKEFVNVGRKHNKTYSLNAKLFYMGARKIIPLLRDAAGNVLANPANGVDSYFDYSKAYEAGLDNVFQINSSASVKINRPKLTHEIAVDIINTNNTTARITEYYDPTKPTKTNYTTPLSLLPNLVYRVKF
jgi:hypothetical protein